jgi:hypothetical protein
MNLDNALNQPNVTIILSTPRSGTTWLGRILRAHPDFQVYKDKTTVLYSSFPLQSLNPRGEDYVDDNLDPSTRLNKFRLQRIKNYYTIPNTIKGLVLISPTYAIFCLLWR